MSALPRFELRRDSFGRLVFTAADGTVHEHVQVVRAFALTAPDEGISILSAEGKELLWAPHLNDLPAATQALLAEEFAQCDFMPVIERIVAVSSFATPSTWRVETDRGPTELLLRSEDDIRRLKGPGALLIADGNGLHFLVRDRNRLDAHSRKILRRFL